MDVFNIIKDILRFNTQDILKMFLSTETLKDGWMDNMIY